MVPGGSIFLFIHSVDGGENEVVSRLAHMIARFVWSVVPAGQAYEMVPLEMLLVFGRCNDDDARPTGRW